jgi:hypothetical protein
MKVSRKVARRSHRSRYSSVSRRRLRNKKTKSGYKKKHAKTQRGGARSRKYGHKRGKRFHRGGVDAECYTELDPRLYGYDSTKDVLLKYKKDALSYTDDTKPFKVQVYGSTGDNNCSSDVGKIVLVRQTLDKPVTITIKFSYQGDVGKIATILSSGVYEKGGKVVKYSVNYKENYEFFIKVFKAISDNSKIINAAKAAAENLKQQEKQAQEYKGWQESQNRRNQQNQLEKEVEATFTAMGDDAEVTLHYTQTIPYVKGSEEIKEIEVKFSDFKAELEKVAETTIQKINELPIPDEQKLVRIERIQPILDYEFKEHLYIMKQNYIAHILEYDITKSIPGKWTLLDLTSRRVKNNEESKKKIMDLGLMYNPPADPNYHDRYGSSSHRDPGIRDPIQHTSTLVPGQSWAQMGSYYDA